MSDVNQLDAKKLAAYLTAHITEFEGPLKAEKFSGGQSNPTFLLHAASGDYVLRRQPPGKLLKSAHAVDREYRVMRALANTDVPVPVMHHLCEDPDVIGSMFYVMEFCHGRVLWDSALPEVEKTERAAMYDAMNATLAALHEVDIEAVGLADYGRPGNYFDRQLGRWTKQYRASEIEPVAPMDALIGWLEKNLPPDDGQAALVHGDYTLNNLMWDAQKPQIIAVIDWELSTLGHPLSDLAYQCMRLRAPLAQSGMGSLHGQNRQALGVPTEAEYVAAYCKRRGIAEPDHWVFYLAFNFFRLAAIAQGIAKRAQQGNASSSHAGWAAGAVQPLAQAALQITREGA